MRNGARVVVLAVGLSLAAASVGATPVYADSVVDNMGDWMATIGKKDMEKQAILTERKAKREAHRAQKQAEKQAKRASKEADKAGKELKKGLGGLTN